MKFLEVVGPQHMLWGSCKVYRFTTLEQRQDSLLRDESTTGPLNGPGPLLVYALTEMLYCTHSWSIFSTR